MLSKTLEDGLTKYAVGAKLRALRLRKKIGLVDLGKHTGLSPALLSKIETGKLFPTLPTLLRIAMTFSVGLEHFFSASENQPVLAIVRRLERQRFPESPGAKDPSYHFESLDFPAKDRRLNAYYAEFHPVAREKIRLHQHGNHLGAVDFLGSRFLACSDHIGQRGSVTLSNRRDLHAITNCPFIEATHLQRQAHCD